jgi:tRNA(Ile)-lysidine synthase
MRERAGDLFRPLLSVGRSEVLAHLRTRSLAWREDPTNDDPAHLRNRVRAELLPYLERRFNPAVRETLSRSATVLADESDLLDGLARELHTRATVVRPDVVALSREVLRQAPRALARLTLRQVLAGAGGLRGVTAQHVERLLDLLASPGSSGRSLPLPGGRRAIVHFDEVRIGGAALPATPFSVTLPVPGRVTLPGGRTLEARPARRLTAPKGTDAVVRVPGGPLTARTRRPGDRVKVGRREVSLKRYLMDRRVPAAERPGLPLVAAGAQVVWVAGHPPEPEAEADAGARFVRIKLRTARRVRGESA